MAENSDAFPSCPIPELARLSSALRKWKAQILAYFDTAGASNGPTKAINGVIVKARSRSRQRWIYTKECMRSTWGEHRPGSPNPRAGPLLHMLTVETTLRPGRQPKSLRNNRQPIECCCTYFLKSSKVFSTTTSLRIRKVASLPKGL